MASDGNASAERRRWDARYALAAPGPPARLLMDWLPSVGRGAALDIACGTGRNTLALAAAGFLPVVGVDLSAVGLHAAVVAAAERGLRADFICADLATFPFPRAHFDLICVFRFLDRHLAPRIMEALRPGGTLIYQTFTVDQAHLRGGPHRRDLLLEHGELRAMFADLAVLHYAEESCDEDGHPSALAGLVARRPEPEPTPGAARESV